MTDSATTSMSASNDVPHTSRFWLLHAGITTVLWGVWGALIELPEKAGFPATLGYVAWAVTMVPVAVVALRIIGWKLDHDPRSIFLGMSAGLMGCAGQLLLFQCLRIGPAYIVFPFISLYPVVTVVLSVLILREKASVRAWVGIALAIVAIALLAYQPDGHTVVQGVLWIVLAVLVFVLWGGQGFIMKFASDRSRGTSMKAESVTFYLMASSIVLSPIALMMTDFSSSVNWGMSGAWAAVGVQALNAVGFLFFAYAIKLGKAIIVVPLMSLAPAVTVGISLLLYSIIPHPITVTGMVLALISVFLLAE